MSYPTLVYSMLVNQFWSITPALPIGSVAVRPDVGFPEIIPNVTFITRELIAADGFDAAHRNHSNLFIQQARQYHNTYGLAPVTVNSVEDMLDHFQGVTTQIDRIRIVTHGNLSFMFFPLFTSGKWDTGIQVGLLPAFQNRDDEGLRFIISSSSTRSPLLIDVVTQIVDVLRGPPVHPALIPLGLQSTIPDDLKPYLDIVSDLFQAEHGTIGARVDPPKPPPPPALPPRWPPPYPITLGSPQQIALTDSLKLIETQIRGGLTGTVINGRAITDADLNALKAAVLGSSPIKLGFLGPPIHLAATVIADVNAVMVGTPTEPAIRTAITGATGEPLFFDYYQDIIGSFEIFEDPVLRLGGTMINRASIQSDPNLTSFIYACADLNFLKNGPLLIGGTEITDLQRTALRASVLALVNMKAAAVRAATSTITAAQLTTLRTAIENRPLRLCAITGVPLWRVERSFADLIGANRALQANFRAKLDHFRTLIKPGNDSKIDVRGCLIGLPGPFSPTLLLDELRAFLGSAANQPEVSAPSWFQSFPLYTSIPARFSQHSTDTNIGTQIHTLVTNGISEVNISGPDVNNSFSVWKDLIDFDPHYDFITGLFADTSSGKRDFAMMGWRIWRVLPATTGIPMLRMQATRIDDIDSLHLGDIVERFRVIFEVPSASAPNASARTKLTSLETHLAAFKTHSDAVAAGPGAAALAGLQTGLTTVANGITTLYPTPAPASPVVPAGATLPQLQASVRNINAHLDTILSNVLGSFFAAMRTKIGEPEMPLRYFLNIGLPLLLQSASHRDNFFLASYVGASTVPAATALIQDAYRSFMRIQWSGNAAQATAMNNTIQALPITNNTQRATAAQLCALSQDDPSEPSGIPSPDGSVCPLETYHDHLVTRP